MEHVEVESPDSADGSLHERVKHVGTCTAKADYGDHILLELGRQICDLCSACQCVVELEDRVGHGLDNSEGVWSDLLQFHRGARYDAHVALDLLEEICELPRLGLVRKA